MMIPVSHDCMMTRQKATTIGCDQSSFYGIGVPLKVLLHAFIDKKIVWYSVQYGDYQDNILLIGIDPEKAHSLKNTRYTDTSPIENVFGISDQFEEYQLSPDIRAALSISVNEETKEYSILDEKIILFQVYIHDDHFSYIKSVDHALLKQLVLCVLQQHSFYLNIEVDWSDILDGTANVVSKTRSLFFQSQPSRGCLVIRPEGIWPWLKSLLFPRFYRAILIINGKARFTKLFLERLNNNNKN